MPFFAPGLAVPNIEELGRLIPARVEPRGHRQVAPPRDEAPRAPLQPQPGQGQGQDQDRRRQNLLLRGIDIDNIIHGRLRPRP